MHQNHVVGNPTGYPGSTSTSPLEFAAVQVDVWVVFSLTFHDKLPWPRSGVSELHAAPSSLEDRYMRDIHTENGYDFSDCKNGCFSIQRFDLDLYTYIAIILVYGTYLWISKLGHGRQWVFHHLYHSQSMESHVAI